MVTNGLKNQILASSGGQKEENIVQLKKTIFKQYYLLFN
jgi:hypothetical protein